MNGVRDPVEVTAAGHLRGFLRDLRAAGLAVPVGRQRDFLYALTVVPPRDVRHLYWIASATLTTSVVDAEYFDPVFAHWFAGAGLPELAEVDDPGTEDRGGGDGDPRVARPGGQRGSRPGGELVHRGPRCGVRAYIRR